MNRDHQSAATGGASGATTTPPITAGTIPAGTAAPTTPSSAPVNAFNDPAKIRNLQLKASLQEALRNNPKKDEILKTLSTPPQSQAQADFQKQLAKDLIETQKGVIPDQQRAQLLQDANSLFGNTPATAPELVQAARDLLPQSNSLVAGQPANAAANPGGATTDPAKVGGPGKADPSKAVDPRQAALDEITKNLKAAVEQQGKNQLAQNRGDRDADALDALRNRDKGEDKGKNDSASSASPSGGDNKGSGGDSAKGDDNKHSESPSSNKNKDRNADKQNNQPPLFGNSSDSKDKEGSSEKKKEEQKPSEPIIDLAKLKESANKGAKNDKNAKTDKSPIGQDAGQFGDAGLDSPVGNPGFQGPPSGIPSGPSQIGQRVADVGGGGGFPLDEAAGGSEGPSFSNSAVASGPGATNAAGVGFPDGVGGEGAPMGGMPMKYFYDKGKGVYPGGGGALGGDAGVAQETDGDYGDMPAKAQLAANKAAQMAWLASQVLVAPVTPAFWAARPAAFGVLSRAVVSYFAQVKKEKPNQAVPVSRAAASPDSIASRLGMTAR